MALSDNIKTRRTQLKMSQEYVADQLGISRQAVAKWESGKSRPTAANLAELAALFEMSVSELVDPEKEKEEQRAQLADCICNRRYANRGKGGVRRAAPIRWRWQPCPRFHHHRGHLQ